MKKVLFALFLFSCSTILAQVPSVKSTARIASIADNPVRFAIKVPENFGRNGDMKLLQQYNHNPVHVQVGNNAILIKKEGMYKIDGYLAAAVYGSNFSKSPTVKFDMIIGDERYEVSRTGLILSDWGDTKAYFHHQHFSFEIYIPANTTIKLFRNFSNTESANASNISSSGWLLVKKTE